MTSVLRPFPFETPIAPDALIDRREELMRLSQAAAERVHVRMAGPRRFGKTSLLLAHAAGLSGAGWRTVHVDMYGVTSLAELCVRIATSYSRLKDSRLRAHLDSLGSRLGMSLTPAGPGLTLGPRQRSATPEATQTAAAELLDLPLHLYGAGKSWGGQFPVGPRVLTILSARGQVVRATNDGPWTSSRPRWASMRSWTGRSVPEVDRSAGVATLVRWWLAAFGPGTLEDIKWWLGGTVAATRRALVDVGAVEVVLGEKTGFVLPDDVGPTAPVDPWAALLPELDPATMGWFDRDWYLRGHRHQLFDSNGNGGNTAWWDGRIVGGWHQSPAGEVVVDLLEDVGREARRALEVEAGRLTDWLGGIRVTGRYPSPLSKRVPGGGPVAGT